MDCDVEKELCAEHGVMAPTCNVSIFPLFNAIAALCLSMCWGADPCWQSSIRCFAPCFLWYRCVDRGPCTTGPNPNSSD